MHRVKRTALPASVATKLAREQTNANAKLARQELDVEAEWARARRNIPLKSAYAELRRMAGKRERCMYCGDSHGTDIEHFWPKRRYPKKMFRWHNMLLGCTACGRDHKGDKFPMKGNKPMLVNPTKDDPWQHLDFDPITGNVTARYDAHRNRDLKGDKTRELLGLDRREALAAGYLRTFKHLKARIADAVANAGPDATAVISDLRDEDDYGLLGWCFRGNGTREEPMRSLERTHPAVWQACVTAFKYA